MHVDENGKCGRGSGDKFLGFLVSWFLVFWFGVLSVSRFLGLLVYSWFHSCSVPMFLGFLHSKLQSFKIPKMPFRVSGRY